MLGRAALDLHWAAFDASDFEVEHQIYREDAVLEYPQSGERIRGRRNIQASRAAQPNKKRFAVRRIVGAADLWITEFVLTYDGEPSYSVSIMEFWDGKVARETQYFGDAFAPGPSRAQWVEADRPRRVFARPAPASGRSASARQVETRAEICERWLPLWRSLTRHQSASPQLHSRIGRVYDLITERLKLMYRPELSTLAEPQSARILIALETLTDFESWGRMRERHGLSAEAACVVWTEAIDRLLPPTPA